MAEFKDYSKSRRPSPSAPATATSQDPVPPPTRRLIKNSPVASLDRGESQFSKDKTRWSVQLGRSETVGKPLVASANDSEAAIIDYAAVKRLSLFNSPPSSLKAPSKSSSRRRKDAPAPLPVPSPVIGDAYPSSDEEAPPAELFRSTSSRRRKSAPYTATSDGNSLHLHLDEEEQQPEAICVSNIRTNGASTGKPSDTMELTPQDNHYLNKIFTCLQLQREFSSLSQIGTLTSYGAPFLSYPNGPNSRPQHLLRTGGGVLSFLGGEVAEKRKAGWEEYEWVQGEGGSPVLGYLYWRFIFNFPALRLAKTEYWTEQIQPFFDSFAERDLSTTKERSEVTKRRLLAMGLTRILGTYYGTCIRPIGPSSPARPSIAVMRRIDHLFPGSMESLWRTLVPGSEVGYNAWAAIVETEAGRKGNDVYTIVARLHITSSRPLFLVYRPYSAFRSLASSLTSLDPHDALRLPVLPRPTSSSTSRHPIPPSRPALQSYLRTLIISLSAPPASALSSLPLIEARTALEKFLLHEPEEVLRGEIESWVSSSMAEDVAAEIVRQRWVGAGKRVKKLRTMWALWKGALISGDEMDKTMKLVRRTPTIAALPENYRDAQEWARIWVAYALHYVFIVAPNGPEIVQLLKSFHGLIPYAALKLGLSLVNPTLAIRAIVALVLGQPAGQLSLFQRIFSLVLGSGIKVQKRLIDSLRKKLAHDSLADAVAAHVYAPFSQRAATRDASQDDEEDMLISIVRDHGTHSDLQLVREWHADFVRRGLNVEGAAAHVEDSSSAGRYQSLKNLLRAYCRKRDREQVLEIAMEHNTPVLLRASISVFYDSIYKIANASNLAARLGDLQAFLDDLLKVCASDKREPADFIKLAARHEQKLYFFVHELASNGGSLLDPLIEWCKSGLNFIDSGIPFDATVRPSSSRRPSTRSSKSGRSGPRQPHHSHRAGVDYASLLSTTNPETRAAILVDARGLALWTSYKKCYSDLCLRADLLAMESDTEIDKGALYSDLLSRDREVLAYLDARGEEAGERPEDQVGWAWFAEEDVLDDPSSIKLDWKAAANAEAALAAARRKEKMGKRLSRKSSRGTLREEEVVEEEPRTERLQIPPPKVKATKTLLDAYVGVITRSLAAAKEANVLMHAA